MRRDSKVDAPASGVSNNLLADGGLFRFQRDFAICRHISNCGMPPVRMTAMERIAFVPSPLSTALTSPRRRLTSGARISTRAELAVGGRTARTRTPPAWILQVNGALVGGALRAVDAVYGGDAGPWSRLWVLEVVARVPYFAFLCTLHLAESLGLGSHRVTQLQRAHFAEADNEAVHLAIMSELGGGSRWRDRFVAQHAAIVYFWVNIVAYVLCPSLAYSFSELVEDHAFQTYDGLLRKHEHYLKHVAPVPLIAHDYYTSRPEARDVGNLYQVIEAIRDDEAEHAEDLAGYCGEFVGSVPWDQSREKSN